MLKHDKQTPTTANMWLKAHERNRCLLRIPKPKSGKCNDRASTQYQLQS